MKKITFFAIFLFATGFVFSQNNNDQPQRPLQFTFFYPISTNGTETNFVNDISFNVLVGYNGGVNGFELGGLVNMNRKNVNGCQIAGLANLNGGKLDGVGIAGLINVASTIEGTQIAGLVNYTETIKNGLQLAGLANYSNKSNGVQIATLANISKKSNKLMLAALVNIADSAKYPIALVNIIKYNSLYRLTLWTDESNSTNISFKSGSTNFYGIIGLGYNPFFTDLRYSINAGIGYRTGNRTLCFDLEAILTNNQTFKKNNPIDYWLVSLRPLLTFKKLKHVEFTVGPTFNYLNTSDYEMAIKANLIDFVTPKTFTYNNYWTIGMGFSAGISYVF